MTAYLTSKYPDDFSKITLIDGPGVRKIIEANIPDKYDRQKYYDKVQIVNGSPNLVNTWGEHPPGKYIKLGEEGSKSYFSNPLLKFIETAKHHVINSLIEHYKNGKIQEVNLWPVCIDGLSQHYGNKGKQRYRSNIDFESKPLENVVQQQCVEVIKNGYSTKS